jgi:hypothetical protein
MYLFLLFIDISEKPFTKMEFYLSTRGGKIMAYQGFEYKLHKSLNGIAQWRCKNQQQLRCKYWMKVTVDERPQIITEPTEHSHDSFPQKIKANIAMQKMKETINSLGANPRNVMGTVLNELQLSQEVQAHMPKNASITRTLNRIKKKARGNDIVDPEIAQFPIPLKYRAMILRDSGEEDPDRILAIGDLELLRELQKDTIFGDGTFDKVPKMFYQLYAWHSKIGNSYPPCIYFLLQKKTQATYNRMFVILKELLPNLSPQTILLDFEKACMTAGSSCIS